MAYIDAADTVIIGAGIYGCLTGLRLAQTANDVLLLEAKDIASGASGGPGKRGVRANGRDLRELALMSDAFSLWSDIASTADFEAEYDQRGSLQLYAASIHNHGESFEAMRARGELQKNFGVATEILDRTEVAEFAGPVGKPVVGGLYCKDDGIISHESVTVGIARKAVEHGVRIASGEYVYSITELADGMCSVETTSGAVLARRQVVVLANTGVTGILSEVAGFSGARFVSQIRPQMLFLERSQLRSPSSEPLVSPLQYLLGHGSKAISIKMLSDAECMVSGGWSGNGTNTSESHGLSLERAMQNISNALDIAPELDSFWLKNGDASRVESVSIDGVPLLGTLGSASQILYAYGWSGHGFAIAPALVELVVRLLNSGEVDRRLEPFLDGRFVNPESNG